MTVVGDPALHIALRLALAALFASAAVHKARDLPGFAATLRNYRIAPESSTGVISAALVFAETAIAFGLLWRPVPAAMAATALLAAYSAAIAINLARGRRDIDCGCLGPNHRQPLSEWLLVRNGGAIAAAGVILAPPVARPLGGLDALSIAATCGALTLIWLSANQLMETWPRLQLIARRASQ